MKCTEIGVGRYGFKGKDTSNTLEIAFVAGNQNRSQFTAGISEQDVEYETSWYRLQCDSAQETGSINSGQFQRAQCWSSLAQFSPKTYQTKCYLDRFPFGSGPQIFLSSP